MTTTEEKKLRETLKVLRQSVRAVERLLAASGAKPEPEVDDSPKGRIVRACCDFYRVSRADFDAPSRPRSVAWCRFAAAFLWVEQTDLPLIEADKEFGFRPGWAQHAVSAVRDRLLTDLPYAHELEQIRDAVKTITQTVGSSDCSK